MIVIHPHMLGHLYGACPDTQGAGVRGDSISILGALV
jgi:hypothetical protein